MPRPKDDKEQVVYPPSKRKAPAFKPLRPTKVARGSTEDSESSSVAAARTETVQESTNAKAASSSRRLQMSTGRVSGPAATNTNIDEEPVDLADSSDELPEDPLAVLPRNPLTRPPAQRGHAALQTASTDVESLANALAPDIDPDANIPQALLLRLMHEHFDNKDTKIDKVAIGVLQKYVDLFVRETIARAVLNKKDDVDLGKASQSDVNWLDREDLEKVAGGMLMDF